MKIAISRTTPFRHLQKQIGSATYRLNTILVGLEEVARGVDKPPSMPVTWTKPTSADQARNAANQASVFACTSAFVFACDIFDQFLSNIASESWLNFSPDTIAIATKAKARPSGQGGAYSVYERTSALLSELNIPVGPAAAGIELLAKWRNVSVHTQERKSAIDDGALGILTESKAHFHDHYSHLDIDLALRNFFDRKNPVPKEATSLIALVQNVSRNLDEAAIKRVAGTDDLIANVADKLLHEYFSKEEYASRRFAEISDAWQGEKGRRLAILLKVMQKVGLTEAKNAVSAVLPIFYIEGLLDLTRDKFWDRFGGGL